MAASLPLIDDSRHDLLTRAHAPAQVSLDAAFGPLAAASLPRSRYGATSVQELSARTALTLCRMGDEPWSLNPYMGCSHACAYCYVPDVAKVERERWGSYVIVKRNLLTLLSRELKRREPRPVFLSSATDPYQPAEAEHRLTRSCLEVLLKHDWPLRVLTRSPLVTRDIDLLTRFSDVEVGLSVTTLDDEARAAVEPEAPPIPARLRALRTLSDAGLSTYANLAPCYPLTGGVTPGAVAAAFQEARAGMVVAGAWRYMSGVLPALRSRLRGTTYARFERAVQDEAHYAMLFRSLKKAFADADVPFRVMGDPKP